MRELHVVEPAPASGRVALATADGLERFELVVDQALRDAVTRTAPSTPSAEPGISPREIQVRVRAGESPQDIATSHGAELSWVQRFAEPVLAERRRVADEARRAKARRSEGQAVIFGETVDDRFAQHGIDPSTVHWDAHRTADGQWLITARWVGGQSEHGAEWALQLGTRTVAAIDETAADLLSDRPIRPFSGPVTADEPTAPEPDAHTGPLPRAEPAHDVFDQTLLAAVTPAVTPAPAPAHAAGSAPAPVAATATSTSAYEPPLPLDVPGSSVHAFGIASRPETDEEKAARASIPSWDDILLGVRRKRD